MVLDSKLYKVGVSLQKCTVNCSHLGSLLPVTQGIFLVKIIFIKCQQCLFFYIFLSDIYILLSKILEYFFLVIYPAVLCGFVYWNCTTHVFRFLFRPLHIDVYFSYAQFYHFEVHTNVTNQITYYNFTINLKMVFVL